MVNRLSGHNSSYLRDYSDDPIDWWPWCREAFDEAQRREVPVIVSIGYLACHWCAVMHREMIADESLVNFLNDHYVAIKVDREQHPAVDQVFMNATQTLTGQGGWPNTVFCTPEGMPFFAGTYFPAQPQGTMPSFMQVLEALNHAWHTRRSEVFTSADMIVSQLRAQRETKPEAICADHVDPNRLLQMLHSSYDARHGGFGPAPKFPQPAVIDALFARVDQANNDRGLYTLDAISRGGIYDQVGGGFHRYCVDAGWEVPHFEKMLVDNALLIGSYTRGWLHAVPDDGTEQRERFELIVVDTVEWLIDQMRVSHGGFAVGMGADSAPFDGCARTDAPQVEADGNGPDLSEGAFYLWTSEQFDRYLGKDSRFAQGVFHVTHSGNLPRGAHEPTDGTGRATLQFHGNPHPGRIRNVRQMLRVIRDQRPRPERDDLVVTAYNGLLVDSLVYAAMIFHKPEWLQIAVETAELIWNHGVRGDRVMRVIDADFDASVDGVLADYICAAAGFIRVGCALGQFEWIRRADKVMNLAWKHFDVKRGAGALIDGRNDCLFDTSEHLDDDAMPSANSVAVKVLRLLDHIMGKPQYSQIADAIMADLYQVMVYSPRYCGWGLADAIASEQTRLGYGAAQIVVVSDDPFNPLTRAAWRLAPWGSVVITAPEGTQFADLFDHRTRLTGADTAYICRGSTCLKPVTDWATLRQVLLGESTDTSHS